MFVTEIMLYALIGIFAGISAGLLGIGGGLIIVPFLLMIFKHFESIPFEFQVHVAIATSLLTIVFTSLSAIYSQQRKKAIDWSLFWRLMPGILFGSFVGAGIASEIPRTPLLIIFSLFVLAVGIKMWYGWSPHSTGKLPGLTGINLVSFVIGVISAIVGIGGGSLTVPFLSWGKIIIQRAIAVSSALGLPIAISGSAGFYISSIGLPDIAFNMIGYVFLPAFVTIIIFSMLTAGFGVYLSHKLPKQTLSRIFSVLLITQAAKILIELIA